MFNPIKITCPDCKLWEEFTISAGMAGQLEYQLDAAGWLEVGCATEDRLEWICPDCVEEMERERAEEEAKDRDQDRTDALHYAEYVAGGVRSCGRAW